MLKSNESDPPNFLSNAQEFMHLINAHFTGHPEKQIGICKLPLNKKKFIIPYEEADSDYIPLQSFLVLLEERLIKEISYKKELIELKNSICSEIEKFCAGNLDKELLILIHNHRQSIVDLLFDLTKFDENQLALKLYNNLTYGFEKDALEHFERVAYQILWKPLLTPIPIGLTNYITKQLSAIQNKADTKKIDEIMISFGKYVGEYLKIQIINTNNYDSEEKLKIEFENLVNQRRLCSVFIRKLTLNYDFLIEYVKNCIQLISIKVSPDEFLETDIKFEYDYLHLTKIVKKENYKDIIAKLPKGLKSLKARFMGFDGVIIKIVFPNLLFLNTIELNLDNNRLYDDGIIALSRSLSALKTLTSVKLALAANYLNAAEMQTFSAEILKLNDLTSLNLDLSENNMEDKGIEHISASLVVLQKIVDLNLNFRQNNVGNRGIEALSKAISKMHNLRTLELEFAINQIDDIGIIALSDSLINLKIITSLSINFRENQITNAGVRECSIALGKLINLQDLSIDFAFNNIDNESMLALSENLPKIQKLKTICITFAGNTIEDAGLQALYDTIVKIKYIQEAYLYFIDNQISPQKKLLMKKAAEENSSFNLKIYC